VLCSVASVFFLELSAELTSVIKKLTQMNKGI